MTESATSTFFIDLHGSDQINFRCIKKQHSYTLNGRYNLNTQQQLKQLNEQEYENYFVPNTGGYKDQQITKYNCVFVDLDCGRKESRDYFTLEETELYKKEKLKALNQFEFEPSYVVETRNGLHAYWLVDEGVRLEQFQECEERLIAFFGGDPAVKNPARLLRVPDSYWHKDPANKFLVRIIQSNRARYDIVDLITSLPMVETNMMGVKSHPNKKCTLLIRGTKSKITNTDHHSNVEFIKIQDVKGLHALLYPKLFVCESHEEVYDYLKKQDLAEFLGVSGYNFNCIFHNDTTPSAGILINKESGHHVYNCLSSSCNVSYNIIQVVEKLTGLDTRKSLNFLREVYKIEYKDSEWKRERGTKLDNNIILLLSSDLEEKHPHLNRFVIRYSSTLTFLHQFSKEKINTTKHTDKYGNPVFFGSNSFFGSKLGKDQKTIRKQINLLAYLGLIRKLPIEEIPNDLLVKARDSARLNNLPKIVTYYSIPIYEDYLIEFASSKAIEYKEQGFNFMAFGREMLYRALGEKEAGRVFPHERGKKLSETSSDNSMMVEKMILYLIDLKGWTDEREILMNLDKQNGKHNHNKLLLKRILPEVLDKYGLIKRRLNKQLKEDLQIKIKGYPNIIVLED
jgi:hypothetical protein